MKAIGKTRRACWLAASYRSAAKNIPRSRDVQSPSSSRVVCGDQFLNSPARLFVCVGKKVVGKGLAALIGARPITPVPFPWGEQPITIDRYQAPDGRVVVAFPHFSRFPPFSSAERSRAAVDAIKEV